MGLQAIALPSFFGQAVAQLGIQPQPVPPTLPVAVLGAAIPAGLHAVMPAGAGNEGRNQNLTGIGRVNGLTAPRLGP